MIYETMTRKELQKRLAGKQKLHVRLRELHIKRAEIKAQIDVGNLTERAILPIQTEIDDVSREINTLENGVASYLQNTCPDENLKREFDALQRRRRDIIDRRRRQQLSLQSNEARLKEQQERRDQARADDARRIYGKEIDAGTRELNDIREEVLDLERQLAALDAEREELKRRMIAA